MIASVREFISYYFQVEIINDFDVIAIVAFLGIVCLALFLRCIVNMGYQTQYSLFKLCAKDIASEKEIRDTRSGLLNRITKDFIKAVRRGVSNIDTAAITSAYVNRLNFLGWSLRSMEGFITSIESSVLLFGIAMALFFEQQAFFAAMGVVAFVLLKFFEALFDFVIKRERLVYEVTSYVEREIGQFYSTSVSTTIQMLKLEIRNIVKEQSAAVGSVIDKLGLDIANVLKLSMSEMTKNVETAVNNLNHIGDVFVEPMRTFKETIIESDKLQQNLNVSYEKIRKSTENLEMTLQNLSGAFSGQKDYLHEFSEAVSAQITSLTGGTENLLMVNENNAAAVEGLKKSLAYIRDNQLVLEKSLQDYELALEKITSKIGDGFGSIVQFHTEAAYNSFNETIQENITKISLSNKEIILRLEQLFEHLAEQSKGETQAIMRIYEQMDMHFEALKD